jgi:hypothetical protein
MRTIVVIWILMLLAPVVAWAQAAPTCETFKEYQPQSTPEETYRLEMDMMKQGAYCYDIPIFDQEWQAKAEKNSYGNDFKRMAGYFDVPSKTFQEGKYAVIYYPDHKTLGPVFFYRENGKWILDRTSAWKYIHYEDAWLAYDGDYPYLDMLKTLFMLEERTTRNGQKVYKVK